MKIYFDTSCLSRPFDDQSQQRIHVEAEAVKLILERSAGGEWQHVSSEMVIIEIEANPDPDKRRKAMALVPAARDIIGNTDAIVERAAELADKGFRAADAVHVSAAEAQGADVLLTCDDRLVRVAGRTGLGLRVVNPVDWLRENQHASDT